MGVGSEGCELACTARLWLVTASCSAFNTFTDKKKCIITHPKYHCSRKLKDKCGFNQCQYDECPKNEEEAEWLEGYKDTKWYGNCSNNICNMHTFFSSEERRLTNAEILYNKVSRFISETLIEREMDQYNWLIFMNECKSYPNTTFYPLQC